MAVVFVGVIVLVVLMAVVFVGVIVLVVLMAVVFVGVIVLVVLMAVVFVAVIVLVVPMAVVFVVGIALGAAAYRDHRGPPCVVVIQRPRSGECICAIAALRGLLRRITAA